MEPSGLFRSIFPSIVDGANFPWISQAQWIFSQMVRWGQVAYSPEANRQVASAFRPDLYRNALGAASDIPVTICGSREVRRMTDSSMVPYSIQKTFAAICKLPQIRNRGPESDGAE